MKPLLNRRQRLAAFRLYILLSLVRWWSVVTVMMAQYLAAIFLLNKDQPVIDVLLDYRLHLTVLSTAFIVAGGFIINSFYDIERDTINKPNKVIINRLISSHFCLNLYFLLNTIGMVLSFYVSKRLMLFNLLFSFALWFYSHKIRKKAFLGELNAALLTVAPFFSIIVYYNHLNFDIFFYVVYISVIILIREILKDIISQKGDLIYDYDTLALIVGMEKTKRIIWGLMLLTFVLFGILLQKLGFNTVMIYFFAGELVVAYTAFLLYRAKTLQDFKRLNNLYKIMLFAGIILIPLAELV